MRYLIIGDLHGKIPHLSTDEFDAIIAPGDFCSDDSKKYQFKALQLRLQGQDVHWEQLAGRDRARRLKKKSVADGRRVLAQLNTYGVPVYAVPGNWDPEESWGAMRRGLKNIVDLHQRSIQAGELTIVGYGYSMGPEYPQSRKERARFSAKEIKKMTAQAQKVILKLGKLVRRAKTPVLLLSHNVPYNTPIDKINNPASPRNGEHFGSVIARKVIGAYKPLLCVGGHMHEHFTSCTLGRTTCINAGFGPNVNVIVEVINGKVVDIGFYERVRKRKSKRN